MPSKRVLRMKAARRLGTQINPLPTASLVKEVASQPSLQAAPSDSIPAVNVRPYLTALLAEPTAKVDLSPAHPASDNEVVAVAAPSSAQRSFKDKALDMVKTVINLGAPVYALASVIGFRIRSLCWWMC